MPLADQIQTDYTTALKNRETEKVNTLRLMLSSLKNEAIKVGGLGTVLTDDQAMSVLSREIKQRHDAASQYEAANRPELAEKEKAEIAVIETYLSKSLDEDSLHALVEEVLQETGATQKSDMGKVMAALKSKLSNPTDVAKAAPIVNQRLS